ncbi:MAG: hypothetical protein EZS28_026273, partial [Streblomastix strix]
MTTQHSLLPPLNQQNEATANSKSALVATQRGIVPLDSEIYPESYSHKDNSKRKPGTLQQQDILNAEFVKDVQRFMQIDLSHPADPAAEIAKAANEGASRRAPMYFHSNERQNMKALEATIDDPTQSPKKKEMNNKSNIISDKDRETMMIRDKIKEKRKGIAKERDMVEKLLKATPPFTLRDSNQANTSGEICEDINSDPLILN